MILKDDAKDESELDELDDFEMSGDDDDDNKASKE